MSAPRVPGRDSNHEPALAARMLDNQTKVFSSIVFRQSGMFGNIGPLIVEVRLQYYSENSIVLSG
jgi:hypothetical protein